MPSARQVNRPYAINMTNDGFVSELDVLLLGRKSNSVYTQTKTNLAEAMVINRKKKREERSETRDKRRKREKYVEMKRLKSTQSHGVDRRSLVGSRRCCCEQGALIGNAIQFDRKSNGFVDGRLFEMIFCKQERKCRVRCLHRCAFSLPLAMMFNLLTCDSSEDAFVAGVNDAERTLVEFGWIGEANFFA